MMPEAARRNLAWTHQLMLEIDGQPNKRKALAAAGEKWGHLPGCDTESFRRKYYAWIRAGRCAEALLDRRRLKKNSPVGAVEKAYKRYAENNQRVSSEAFRQLLRDLSAGVEIPGVGTWQSLFRKIHPDAHLPARCPWGVENPPPGWSYANLQRRARLSDFEKAAARQGLGAAMEHVLPVLRTRVGMLPGQVLQFDDLWLDLVGIWPGAKKPVRPLEFACYDTLSGCKIAWGIRPRLDRDDGSRDSLKELEFRFLLAYVLCDVGFHRDGATLVVEHGTAAIRDWLERRISAFSGGKLKVSRSGILGEQVHAGMFPGRGRGNFRMKPLIESGHSLAHHVTAALPAQVGASPEKAPEPFAGLEAYCKSLALAAAKLPEERRNQLLFPALNFNRLVELVGQLYDLMNDRTWHELEGWDECGFVAEEFRLGEESAWFPMAALRAMPADRRAAVAALLESRPDLIRARKLSPREVWARGKSELTRLPRCHVPDLLGPEAARPVRVETNGTIEFQDRYLGPGKHIYRARIETPDGFVQSLGRAASYVAFATPYHPEHLWIVDKDSGALLGFAPRYDRAGWGDESAIHELLGLQRADLAELSAPVRERHADQAAGRAALLAHNEAVIEGIPPTPAEPAARLRIPKTSGRLDDLIPPTDGDAEETKPHTEREAAREDIAAVFG